MEEDNDWLMRPLSSRSRESTPGKSLRFNVPKRPPPPELDVLDESSKDQSSDLEFLGEVSAEDNKAEDKSLEEPQNNIVTENRDEDLSLQIEDDEDENEPEEVEAEVEVEKDQEEEEEEVPNDEPEQESDVEIADAFEDEPLDDIPSQGLPPPPTDYQEDMNELDNLVSMDEVFEGNQEEEVEEPEPQVMASTGSDADVVQADVDRESDAEQNEDDSPAVISLAEIDNAYYSVVEVEATNQPPLESLEGEAVPLALNNEQATSEVLSENKEQEAASTNEVDLPVSDDQKSESPLSLDEDGKQGGALAEIEMVIEATTPQDEPELPEPPVEHPEESAIMDDQPTQEPSPDAEVPLAEAVANVEDVHVEEAATEPKILVEEPKQLRSPKSKTPPAKMADDTPRRVAKRKSVSASSVTPRSLRTRNTSLLKSSLIADDEQDGQTSSSVSDEQKSKVESTTVTPVKASPEKMTPVRSAKRKSVSASAVTPRSVRARKTITHFAPIQEENSQHQTEEDPTIAETTKTPPKAVVKSTATPTRSARKKSVSASAVTPRSMRTRSTSFQSTQIPEEDNNVKNSELDVQDVANKTQVKASPKTPARSSRKKSVSASSVTPRSQRMRNASLQPIAVPEEILETEIEKDEEEATVVEKAEETPAAKKSSKTTPARSATRGKKSVSATAVTPRSVRSNRTSFCFSCQTIHQKPSKCPGEEAEAEPEMISPPKASTSRSRSKSSVTMILEDPFPETTIATESKSSVSLIEKRTKYVARSRKKSHVIEAPVAKKEEQMETEEQLQDEPPVDLVVTEAPIAETPVTKKVAERKTPGRSAKKKSVSASAITPRNTRTRASSSQAASATILEEPDAEAIPEIKRVTSKRTSKKSVSTTSVAPRSTRTRSASSKTQTEVIPEEITATASTSRAGGRVTRSRSKSSASSQMILEDPFPTASTEEEPQQEKKKVSIATTGKKTRYVAHSRRKTYKM